MTAKKGTLALVLVDEFDFSSDTSQVSVTCAMAEEECTTLQSDAVKTEPILPSMKLEQNGYISGVGDPGTLEEELYNRLGISGSFVAALFGTDVAACPAYVMDNTFGANMQIQAPTKSLMTLNGAWGMGRGGHRGIRVFSGELTATGAQTAVDLGAAGSVGGECFLFVQAIDGSASNAVAKVQSSASSGGTYADEATFTFSDVGGYKAAMSGTVNEWVRLNLTGLGGADGITFVLIVCLDGVTE